MKQSYVLAVVLSGLLAACSESPKPVAELTCQDSPQGRSKEEQTAIADACFRQGGFKKSSGREW